MKSLRNRHIFFRRQFSTNPRPEEGVVDKKIHINEAQQRFQRLLRREILPFVMLSFSVIVYFKFQTEILNMVVPAKYLQMQAFSEKEDRFIARKLSGLMA